MKLKRILATILLIAVVATSFSSMFTASALSVNRNYPTKNITGYIMSTNNKTAAAYSNSSLTNRVGYIYASDDCTIQAIYTNGVVKVRCPWSGYRNGRIVYTRLSYFFQNTSSPSIKTAIAKTKCYNRSNLSKSLGHVYVGDRCYIVGSSGNYYQVLCPWTGGVYRICWVNKSAFAHSHSYTKSGYEAAHPHRYYRKCSCGAYYYTGSTRRISSCYSCYPHKHSYSISGYGAVHPHKVYRKCSCGKYFYTGSTKRISSCTTCYPKQTYAKTIKLNVPLYKQKDSRWSNVYIGDKTIGNIGCTTTCIAMVYSYNTGTTVYPNKIKEKLAYSNNDLYWYSISNVGLTSTLYNSSMSNNIMSTIYSKLKAGRPVIIGAQTSSNKHQHWVVITGYTGSSTTNFSTANFTVNDPGYQNSQTLKAFLANGNDPDRTKIIRIMY